ncbi:MAG TPA: nucleotidyltransferase domain-containing protein [Acidobacteriota bacterium]|nr:nucleotidyltransferase domain-containing protein [Acidobacteriota bacterium]
MKQQPKAPQAPTQMPAMPAAIPPAMSAAMPTDIPAEAQEKMKEIMDKLEVFKKRLVDKFEGYVAGIGLLPAGKTIDDAMEEGDSPAQKPTNPNQISVVVLIDDTESQKLTKAELKEKLSGVITSIAGEVDPNIYAQTLIYSELWQYCFDGKTEILQTIASAAPIYDLGMLSAIKIAEIHKAMVLKKFEKYIVSYVLAGSLVQGKATSSSDIDVFIVIDDTDVKKMTRAELKDRLRSIIIGMSLQAGEMTGITNKLNIQCYILTDFWENIKEANPVIFTFLRDGVPLYDRGIFMPWKQLLRMGKIKPSLEAIDMYMQSGEQMLERIKFKMNEIGMEDTFWSILYPSQAALMLYGLPPPTPKETPELLRKVFVKKEKMLEEKYVKILESSIKLRKDLEHGTKKSVTGAELDKSVGDAAEFLTRVKKLFEDIQAKQIGGSIAATYDHIVTIIRDILKFEGVKTVPENKVKEYLSTYIVEKGHAPQKILRMFELLEKAKHDHDAGTLHKSEIEQARVQSQELIRDLVEYMQRKRGIELDRMKLRVKHGEKFGEVILLDKVAFIVPDVDAPERKYLKGDITAKGGISNVTDSSIEELEVALTKIEIPQRAFIKDQIFADLRKVFGKEVEVLVNL